MCNSKKLPSFLALTLMLATAAPSLRAAPLAAPFIVSQPVQAAQQFGNDAKPKATPLPRPTPRPGPHEGGNDD
jgi:hypothetical protein